ncbi:MAG: glycosyltransferase family 2 protein [Thermodesulfobacteriota bacterium]
MGRPPRISIITPSFNQAGFIERTIESVLGQGYPDLEYIVVDGGSTDGTVEILKGYGGRLRWVSEKDKGQSDAINKGIRMSTGEIVAYLNSDDVYMPGALHKVADYFGAHPGVMWATGKCRIIDLRDREMRGWITAYKNFFLARYSYNILLITNFISQPATFLRRGLFDEFGLFDIHHHKVMDYDLWLRVGGRYRPGFIDDYLAGFRVYPQSKTSSSFEDTFRQELEVSRKYSHSRIINALHYLNYAGICAAYTVLDRLARKKRPVE